MQFILFIILIFSNFVQPSATKLDPKPFDVHTIRKGDNVEIYWNTYLNTDSKFDIYTDDYPLYQAPEIGNITTEGITPYTMIVNNKLFAEKYYIMVVDADDNKLYLFGPYYDVRSYIPLVTK